MNRPRIDPHCSIHGDLVRDLARGVLDDAAARRAERALAECGRCRDWFDGALDVAAVEAGVTDGLASFRAPALRTAPAATVPARRWAQAAAAAVLVVAGAAWLAGGRPELATGPERRPVAAQAERASEPAAAPADPGPGETVPGEIIVADDLESGSLGAWVAHSS